MRKDWVSRNKWIFVVGPLALVGFVAAGGEIVMHLWNWLLPTLCGWQQINFWQSLGILALCRILFGRWGGGHGKCSKSECHKCECCHPATSETAINSSEVSA